MKNFKLDENFKYYSFVTEVSEKITIGIIISNVLEKYFFLRVSDVG